MREIKPAAVERYEKKRQTSDPKPETQSLINFLSEGFGTTMPENTANIEDNSYENAREAALYHCSDKMLEQGSTKCWSKFRTNVGATL